MERTLIILKPDGLELGIQSELLENLTRVGLCCLRKRTMQLTKEMILVWRKSWDSYDSWFWEHVDFMVSAPVEIWLVSGPGAVTAVLEVKKLFRGKYASSRTKNILHCPDSVEEVDNEVSLFLDGRG